jgi:hypothetical protein
MDSGGVPKRMRWQRDGIVAGNDIHPVRRVDDGHLVTRRVTGHDKCGAEFPNLIHADLPFLLEERYDHEIRMDEIAIGACRFGAQDHRGEPPGEQPLAKPQGSFQQKRMRQPIAVPCLPDRFPVLLVPLKHLKTIS